MTEHNPGTPDDGDTGEDGDDTLDAALESRDTDIPPADEIDLPDEGI